MSSKKNNSRLEKNLDILKRYSPYRVEEIRNATPRASAQEETSSQAKERFEKLNVSPDLEVIFTYGVGKGHFFNAARGWLAQYEEAFLVFLEDDFSALRDFLDTEEGERLIHQPRVMIVPFAVPKEKEWEFAGQDFDLILRMFAKSSYLFTSLESYEKSRSKMCKQLATHLNVRLREYQTKFQYLKERFLFQYTTNFYSNLLDLSNTYCAYKMQGGFKDVPAIIAGAGPSLKTQFDTIASLKDHAILFGAGTGMNALNKQSIFADFGVGIDVTDTAGSRAIANYAYETPYFNNLQYCRFAYKILHGPKIFFRGYDHYNMESWFFQRLGIDHFPEIYSAVCTTHACLGIAQFLGCNPIILVGVDLSYTDEKRYPKEVTAHPLDDRFEHDQIATLPSELVISAKDYEGNPIYTRVDWLKEATYYSKFAERFPETTIINATKRGLPIPNLPHMDLSEVKEKYLSKKMDLKNQIHEKIQASAWDDPRLATGEQLLEEWKNGFHAIEGLYNELIQEVSSQTKEVKTDRFSEIQHKIHDTDPYNHLLKPFDVAFDENITIKATHVFRCHPESLSDEQHFQTEQEIELLRASYLRQKANDQVKNLERILQQHQKRVKALAKSPESTEPAKGEGGLLQYYASGAIFSRQNFLNDRPHGQQEYFYETGIVKSIINYKNGKLHGPVKLFYFNGQMKRELHFREGALHGKERYWDETGQLLLESEYEADKPVGESKSWYSNGQLKREMVYYDTPEHFDLAEWDEQGNLINKQVFMPEQIGQEAIQILEEVKEKLSRLKQQLGKSDEPL